MFVTDIKENYDSYNLPLRFAEVLPEFCDTCGSPLEIGETLTGLRCSILNFGESTIEKFVDYYTPTSPMDIFELEDGMLLYGDASPKVSADVIKQIKGKNTMQLWEYVMFANIPFVRTSARKIFYEYHSLDEAYADIEKGGVDFVHRKLGLNDMGIVSVQATKVYSNLISYKSDLYSGIEHVNIVDMSNKRQLKVVCSDQVGGRFSKKSEFYSYVNSNFEDVHVDFLPSVSKDIDYLVWAGADGSPARYTSKVQKVERYNEKGSNIPIVTAEQFISMLENI